MLIATPITSVPLFVFDTVPLTVVGVAFVSLRNSTVPVCPPESVSAQRIDIEYEIQVPLVPEGVKFVLNARVGTEGVSVVGTPGSP